MEHPLPWQPSSEYQAVLNRIMRLRLKQLEHEMQAELLARISAELAEQVQSPSRTLSAMSTYAARQAYTSWAIVDTKYQQARLHDDRSPATGEEKPRRVQQLAELAKAVQDAWDEYLAAMQWV